MASFPLARPKLNVFFGLAEFLPPNAVRTELNHLSHPFMDGSEARQLKQSPHKSRGLDSWESGDNHQTIPGMRSLAPVDAVVLSYERGPFDFEQKPRNDLFVLHS
jgi:hypothetical protein